MAAAMTSPARASPLEVRRRSRTLFSAAVTAQPPSTPRPTAQRGSPAAAASVRSPKHTTDTITPPAKLSSRLVLRPESRRSTQAPQPPRPVPPIPAPAVINKVSHSPIRIPPVVVLYFRNHPILRGRQTCRTAVLSAGRKGARLFSRAPFPSAIPLNFDTFL